MRVSYNGALQFTLSFSIVAPPVTFAVTAKKTTGGLMNDGNGNPIYCSVPATKTTFLTTDASVWVWFTYSGAQIGDTFTFHWIHPSGTVDPASRPP